MKIDEKFNKGITLISLIITVIILIILAGVTVNIAIDSQIFDRAEKSSNTVNSKVQQQEKQTSNITQQWNSLDVPSEEEDQLAKITCSACSGNGTITKTCNVAKTEVCASCGGNGICPGKMLPHADESDNGEACDFCGNYYLCQESQCPICGVTYITCFDCADIGIQCKKACQNCQSRGEITTICSHDEYSSHTYTETCEECNGTGQVVIY